MFSKRTNWKLDPNQITLTLERLKRSDKDILDLTQSNPTDCAFSYPQAEILSALGKNNNMSYVPSAAGLLQAREAICEYYGTKDIVVHPDQVILTASTSEAYSFLFRLLADPGDSILFPKPSYPLFEYLAHLNDVDLETYSLVYDHQWKIDCRELARAVNQRTKAIAIVNPNNPTGNFIKEGELEDTSQICRESNLPIICDEVFLDYVLDKTRPVSLANYQESLCFVLGGLSKNLGLPQMKLSWIIINGPKEDIHLAQERLNIISDTYLSVNTPSQNALSDWMKLQPSIQKEIKARLENNFNFLSGHIKNSGADVLQAEGGWYAVLKLPDLHTEEEWVLEFLNSDHTFVHPGYFFDFDQEPFIVISLLTQEKIFQEGMNRVIARIGSYK